MIIFFASLIMAIIVTTKRCREYIKLKQEKEKEKDAARKKLD